MMWLPGDAVTIAGALWFIGVWDGVTLAVAGVHRSYVRSQETLKEAASQHNSKRPPSGPTSAQSLADIVVTGEVVDMESVRVPEIPEWMVTE